MCDPCYGLVFKYLFQVSPTKQDQQASIFVIRVVICFDQFNTDHMCSGEIVSSLCGKDPIQGMTMTPVNSVAHLKLSSTRKGIMAPSLCPQAIFHADLIKRRKDWKQCF